MTVIDNSVFIFILAQSKKKKENEYLNSPLSRFLLLPTPNKRQSIWVEPRQVKLFGTQQKSGIREGGKERPTAGLLLLYFRERNGKQPKLLHFYWKLLFCFVLFLYYCLLFSIVFMYSHRYFLHSNDHCTSNILKAQVVLKRYLAKIVLYCYTSFIRQ